MGGEPGGGLSQHEQLRRQIGVMMLTAVPVLALSGYIGVVSGSLSVVALILSAGFGQSVNLMSYHVLRVVGRGNVFTFPYGTGKLESFASFLYGCSILVVVGIVTYEGVTRLLGPGTEVSLGLAQLGVLLAALRLAFIVWRLRQLLRRFPEPSPLLQVFWVSSLGDLWYTGGILLALLLGWALAGHWGSFVAPTVDLLVAASCVVYLLLNCVRVVRANFRALVDLPLPEADQLQILAVITGHQAAFTQLLNVLTRTSGCDRRVEIELSFAPEVTAREVEALRTTMREELAERLGQVDFHLIARCVPP